MQRGPAETDTARAGDGSLHSTTTAATEDLQREFSRLSSTKPLLQTFHTDF